MGVAIIAVPVLGIRLQLEPSADPVWRHHHRRRDLGRPALLLVPPAQPRRRGRV